MSEENKTNEKDFPKQKQGGRGPFGNRVIESPKNVKKSIKRLLEYFKGQLFILVLVFIVGLIAITLRVISPVLVGISVDTLGKYIASGNNDFVIQFVREMFVLLGVFIGSWLFTALQNAVIVRLANKVVFKLRNDAFTHIQTLSMSFFDKKGLGDIISRFTNDVGMIEQFLTNGVTNLASGIFSIIGYLIAMVVLDFRLSLVVLGTIPFMILLTAIIGKSVRKAFRENQATIGELSSNIQESISGVRVIKTFNREDSAYNIFEKINSKARKVGIKAETISFVFMPIMNLMSAIVLALVVGVGGVMILSGGLITVGLLTSFVMYSRRFLEPLRQLTQIYNVMQSALAGAERIFNIIDTKPDIVNSKKPQLLMNTRGDVEFDNVRFGYVEDKIVLDGITLKAEKGQTVAIVGPTGAGKTTIINLLSRFYDIWDGSIKVDGIDIRDIEMNSLRTKMGVVLQEPFFFASTIKDNLLYANPKARFDEIESAAKLANADRFIRRLPKQYDTVLSERGMNLSQGERQLLAIARAVLADPKILILDEATSNVDSLTEAHIQEGLLKLMKGRTSFIIAHRLSTIKRADKVIVIHNHKIIEEGSHDELMAKGGFYSRLYKLQLKKDMDELTEDMDI